MRNHALQSSYLAAPLLSVLFELSSIDLNIWLTHLQSEFVTRFYAMAVANPNDAVRGSSWESLQLFFAKICASIASETNGQAAPSDSDSDTNMEIECIPNKSLRVAHFLWNAALDCLKASDHHISFAAKAFETGTNMLR